jgi:hypothetical protein
MDLAEQQGAKILFYQRCSRVDIPSNTFYLQDGQGAGVQFDLEVLPF